MNTRVSVQRERFSNGCEILGNIYICGSPVFFSLLRSPAPPGTEKIKPWYSGYFVMSRTDDGNTWEWIVGDHFGTRDFPLLSLDEWYNFSYRCYRWLVCTILICTVLICTIRPPPPRFWEGALPPYSISGKFNMAAFKRGFLVLIFVVFTSDWQIFATNNPQVAEIDTILLQDIEHTAKKSCILAGLAFSESLNDNFLGVLTKLKVAFQHEPNVRIALLKHDKDLFNGIKWVDGFKPSLLNDSVIFFPRFKPDRVCLTPKPKFVPSAEVLMLIYLLLIFVVTLKFIRRINLLICDGEILLKSLTISWCLNSHGHFWTKYKYIQTYSIMNECL